MEFKKMTEFWKKLRAMPRKRFATFTGIGMSGVVLALAFQNFIVLTTDIDYRLKTAASSPAMWAPQNVIDQNPETVFSSEMSPVSINQTIWLAAWPNNAQGPMPINTVLMQARMGADGSPIAFPESYSIFISNRAGTEWLYVGTYLDQPDIEGKVVLSLRHTYETQGVAVIPNILRKDETGFYRFQLAELEVASFEATPTEITLNSGESLEYGAYKLQYSTSGNLQLYTKETSPSWTLDWQSNTTAACATSDCKAFVSIVTGRVILTLPTNTIYYAGVMTDPEPVDPAYLAYGQGPLQNKSKWSTPSGISITDSNAISPDGGATKPILLSRTSQNVFSSSIPGITMVKNTNYKFSVFVKKPATRACANPGYIQMNYAGGNGFNGGVKFDFSSRQSSIHWGPVVNHSMRDVGGGWYKVSMTLYNDWNTTMALFMSPSTSSSELCDVIFWGPKVEPDTELPNITPDSMTLSNWQKAGMSLTKVQTPVAPDGSTPSLLAVRNMSGKQVSLTIPQASILPNSYYTFSAYVKRPDTGACVNPGYIQMNMAGSSGFNAGLNFNFDTNTVSTAWGPIIKSSIAPAANGWSLVSMTMYNDKNTAMVVYVWPSNVSTELCGLNIWNPQVRLDKSMEDAPNMLVNASEPSSWTISNATFANMSVLTPVGTTKAMQLKRTSPNGMITHNTMNLYVANSFYKFSAYVRKTSFNCVNPVSLKMTLTGSTTLNGTANFYLTQGGTVAPTGPVTKSEIQSVGNGWYKVYMAMKNTNNSTAMTASILPSSIGTEYCATMVWNPVFESVTGADLGMSN